MRKLGMQLSEQVMVGPAVHKPPARDRDAELRDALRWAAADQRRWSLARRFLTQGQQDRINELAEAGYDRWPA